MNDRLKAILITAALSAAGVGGIAALLVNIFERKQEARNPFFRVVELTDETDNPAEWGKNFPQQYDGYKRTVDMVRTRFGGSEAVPRDPTIEDPRAVTSQSRLEEDPRLKKMWAGYAFSKDFREERGHAYMLQDQELTGRQAVPQPGACLHCHASMYVPYKKAGGGDLIKGFEKLNPMPYAEAKNLVKHPVSCIDCHDPKSMQLRVTRPGFLEGIAVLAKSTAPVPAMPSVERWRAEGRKGQYDPNIHATRQEMRSFTCGQCHVEYYFKGKEKRLTYPWHNGQKVENIMAYYNAQELKDWIHAVSSAPVLKAQHPEFELWNQGVHARSGVSCADCHMPYMRAGAMKVSDHHIRSPLLNINRSCQTCHHVPEAELKARAEGIQETTYKLRGMALDALLALVDDIAAARKKGVSPSKLEAARKAQREAQFRVDFIEAENSMGFHAPQEAARILAESIDWSRKGQNALRDEER